MFGLAPTPLSLPETWYSIPGGDAGTDATVQHMARLARTQASDPWVLVLAANFVNDSRPLDALREWLDSVLVFTEDPPEVEALYTPRRMLEQVEYTGTLRVDCDDVATLGATLALAMGYPARFVVVALGDPLDASAPYSHVWVEARGGSGWVELDVTRPFQRVPVERITRVKMFDV